MKILVTGGAGFIGSSLIRLIAQRTEYTIVNIDKLTYAGNLLSLESVTNYKNYVFENIDICNYSDLKKILYKHKPNLIMHLAAESHVDRSINDPSQFINTNILGTFNLLEVSREYFYNLNKNEKEIFRFHHISTDEVYGDLDFDDSLFKETTPYSPSSPYSASKASADHLVRAWGRTYGLPILITNCSNNYGPFHYPEKLIPKVIRNVLEGNAIPIFGNGKQIRDWLFVDDHVKALMSVAMNGKIGETYNIGGNNEKTNLEVVEAICDLLQELKPNIHQSISHYRELIEFVEDRPGHDNRYAIDASKIKDELGWVPLETFESGIRKTVEWFLKNQNWLNSVSKHESSS